jgi:AcrR family transcriptional regulator
VATQEQRKADTRRRLLDAAAALFSERGIDAVSIDAIAEAADRTSGAVYAHFGGKDGLLTALLEELKNETAGVMQAELSVGGRLDDRLAAAWRTFADPPPGPGRGWMLLEHELWLYAARHDDARERLARRFAAARRQVAQIMQESVESGDAVLPAGAEEVGTLLVALLVGLEMQHRIDPHAVADATAVVGLRAVTGLGHEPAGEPEGWAPADRRSTPPTPRPGAASRPRRS